MKTIAQFVRDGIQTTDDLKAALQVAMQLEFSTIPPYLCAEWSIDFNNDPDNVMTMIHGVVIQEMYHFGLAGNILSAIGGTPAIANASFLPTYPTNTLPGGIHQALPVDLLPLSRGQLEVFMQIEHPEFNPIALAESPPGTIGAFYSTIAAALTSNNPAINTNAPFMKSGNQVGQIKTIDDALAAIQRIKGEGEGTPQSPDQPALDGNQLAHYYIFKQIHEGKQLINVGGKWDYVGPQIRFPGVFSFDGSASSPKQATFNQQLSQLLTNLQACWTGGSPQPDIGGMSNLQDLGTDLIQNQVRPPFTWAAVGA
ncbi:MAG: ferritin-like protein [Hyphomicrobiales bacterium]|nr:ferritin-like protein [Hyphomicrobiales bacterium]